MLQEKAGQNPELLKVGVLPYMVEFQIKDGERAKGYRATTRGTGRWASSR